MKKQDQHCSKPAAISKILINQVLVSFDLILKRSKISLNRYVFRRSGCSWNMHWIIHSKREIRTNMIEAFLSSWYFWHLVPWKEYYIYLEPVQSGIHLTHSHERDWEMAIKIPVQNGHYNARALWINTKRHLDSWKWDFMPYSCEIFSSF